MGISFRHQKLEFQNNFLSPLSHVTERVRESALGLVASEAALFPFAANVASRGEARRSKQGSRKLSENQKKTSPPWGDF